MVSFLAAFTSNLYAFILYPIRATCPVRLIVLDSVILTTHDEEYK
jgi:hypothetical protein